MFAGQEPEWVKANADEIFYGGNLTPPPGPIYHPDNQKEGDKDLYSHFEGKLALDEQGRNYNGDEEAVDAAIRFVKERNTDQPLCLFLGLMFPHTPYGVEDPYYSAVSKKALKPRIKPEECNGKAEMLKLIRGYQQMEQYSEEDWDELRTVYLGM